MSIIALATTLVGPITELIGKFVQDKDEAAKLAHEIASLAERQAHEINLAQIEVNKAEAESPSLFKGGWRPATGWVCVLSLGNNYLVAPYVHAFTTITIPTLDLAVMSPILMGMLGLGAFRSFEKWKGVSAP